MKILKFSIILIICVILTFTSTYLLVNNVKNSEMNDLKSEYNAELKSLKYDIWKSENDYGLIDLNLSHKNYKDCIIKEKENLTGIWNQTINGTIVDGPYMHIAFCEDGGYGRGPSGWPHYWELVNLTYEFKIIIYSDMGIEQIVSYSLSENNTFLTIGSRNYKKYEGLCFN